MASAIFSKFHNFFFQKTADVYRHSISTTALTLTGADRRVSGNNSRQEFSAPMESGLRITNHQDVIRPRLKIGDRLKSARPVRVRPKTREHDPIVSECWRVLIRRNAFDARIIAHLESFYELFFCFQNNEI